MKPDAAALTVLALSAGVIAGFVIWTYVGPYVSGTKTVTA